MFGLTILSLVLIPAAWGQNDFSCGKKPVISEDLQRVTDYDSCNPPLGVPIALQDQTSAGIDRDYEVRRTGSNGFEIHLNPHFEVAADYDGPKRDPKDLDQKYRIYLNQCFRWAQPFLKGPRGESLTLNVSDQSTVPVYHVKVGNSLQRSNSKNFSSDVDCPTLIHETFHKLGLVDEYPEKTIGITIDPKTGEIIKDKNGQKMGDANAYSCRSLGDPASLMHHQDAAFSAVLGSQSMRYKTCQCTDTNDNCKKLFSKFLTSGPIPTSCPPGLKLVEVVQTADDGPPPPSLESEHPTRPHFTTQGGAAGYWLPLALPPEPGPRTPPSRSSLLSPAQFSMVVTPGCLKRNRLYLACAHNAYQAKLTGCFEAPKECTKPGGLWTR